MQKKLNETPKKRYVAQTKTFSKDLVKYTKSKPEIFTSTAYNEVISNINQGMLLPEKYKDHSLSGNFEGFRECHIFNDLLLIYSIKEDADSIKISYTRLGTHSELFE
ncbi:type II toxin-antitoxin system YafQ family toxin [Lonepinella sp. MS14436]|uniref:type II toxin-antitoxin system RelE/ParE family toxin n=1 Tax=Lonepinella sp. MS14436 TaxID=3003619 RepID=UPI0036D8D096